ncbi:MAG: adenylosuccinate synthetase [Aquificaceae bacterium]|nr:adenylosuccinate synthetase [Aquificaceae bacterium]
MAGLDTLQRVKPVYRSFRGWLRDTRSAKSFSELPQEALEYLQFIQSHLKVRIVMLSDRREEYFWLHEPAWKVGS